MLAFTDLGGRKSQEINPFYNSPGENRNKQWKWRVSASKKMSKWSSGDEQKAQLAANMSTAGSPFHTGSLSFRWKWGCQQMVLIQSLPPSLTSPPSIVPLQSPLFLFLEEAKFIPAPGTLHLHFLLLEMLSHQIFPWLSFKLHVTSSPGLTSPPNPKYTPSHSYMLPCWFPS